MHDETKVNTNNPAASSVDEKNTVHDNTRYAGSIAAPYGRLYMEEGAVEDHVLMRSQQLSNLLLLMHGEGIENFNGLNLGSKDSILWLAFQLATEVEDAIPLLVETSRRKGARGRA